MQLLFALFVALYALAMAYPGDQDEYRPFMTTSMAEPWADNARSMDPQAFMYWWSAPMWVPEPMEWVEPEEWVEEWVPVRRCVTPLRCVRIVKRIRFRKAKKY